MKRQSLGLALFCLLIAGNSCYKNEPVPAADFTFIGNNEFHAPCQVIFTNRSSNAFSFRWEFGDDSTSTEKMPEHKYIKPGNYVVKLHSYTESKKEWATMIKEIIIKPPAE